MGQTSGRHAIVLGGSIGGLLAARVLAEHFAQVTVLERDPLPDQPLPRKGTPHARHTHGLLSQGLDTLEALFPGIGVELTAHGASRGDLVQDCHWHAGGGFHQQVASGMVASAQSRALLEWVVRRRAAQMPNIAIRDQIAVQRLVADDARQRIVGVLVTNRRASVSDDLFADLVIDATGRSSRLPVWLVELGYLRPPEERVEINLGYATRLFRRREGDFGGRMAIVVTQTPPNTRFAAMVKMEGELWTLTVGGILGDHPPLSDEGFREFARGLPTPEVYEFLRAAEPASEIVPYTYAASLRRRYERLPRFPQGILPLGDSICSFNPVYGQGMTVAALEARALGDCLAGGSEHLAARYFRRVARLVETPWQIAVGSDLRNPDVQGRRTLTTRLVNAYLSRVHRAAHHDNAVALAFHRVANLLAAPASLFHPGIVARVLLPRRRRHRHIIQQLPPATCCRRPDVATISGGQ